MRELPQAYFDALDETTERRGGGYLIAMRSAEEAVDEPERETRSRAPRFPRREARMRRLAILTHMLEKENR